MNSKERRVPKRWSEEEDHILYEETQKQGQSRQPLFSNPAACLAEQSARVPHPLNVCWAIELAGDTKDWHRIAAKLPGRTNKDCRKRWVNKVCGSLKKGPWNKNEDECLLDAVDRYGQRWTLVANEVGFRSPDQCAKRWQSKLDPNLEHGRWTVEEDELLLNLVRENGREWKMFQEQKFSRRSTNELKNRYTGLTRKTKNTYNKGDSLCVSPSSGSFNLDYNTDLEDHSIAGAYFNLDGHNQSPREDSVIESLIHQGLTVDWVNALDNSNTWMDNFSHRHRSLPEDILPGRYMPESDSLMDSEKPPERPPIIHKNATLTASESEQVSGVTSSASWPDLVFNPDITNRDATVVDSSYVMNHNVLEDSILVSMQTESCSTSCTDENRAAENTQTPIESSVGRVTLVIDGCNRDTLHSLLDLTKSLRGKTKIEIN
ncbi:Homeodomain-like protein [Xylaria curta]|nr:Homeodomain-like protein [Xylaria curta]